MTLPDGTFQAPPDAATLEADILRHLTFTLGKDPAHAARYDWRMAVSHVLRDRIVAPWFTATRATWDQDRKRVYYLSMEFLIGRILQDAAVNLGLDEILGEVLTGFGQSLSDLWGMNPTQHLAMAGWGGWPRAIWKAWRPWVARPMATASAMNTGCFASGSKAGGRSRRPRTG